MAVSNTKKHHCNNWLYDLGGEFERNIMDASDCKLTNFVVPFDSDTSTKRLSCGEYWIKSEKIQSAFKVSNRTIVEYM